MKLMTLVTAGLVAASGVVPALVAPAAAQRTVVHERTVVRTTHHNYGRYHRRPHRICRVTYRHHHRIRNCHTVYR